MEEKIWAVKDGYLVLRNGTIFRLNWNNTDRCVEVKQSKDKDGYLLFTCNGKKVRSHRFIAECFLPNPDNLPCINHKNEIKNDNRVKNLEWCTYRYNSNYGTAKQRWSEKLTNHPKRSKKILQYALNGEFIKEWCSLSEINRVLGFNDSYISRCCKGECKSAYSFNWFYADNILQETSLQTPL